MVELELLPEGIDEANEGPTPKKDRWDKSKVVLPLLALAWAILSVLVTAEQSSRAAAAARREESKRIAGQISEQLLPVIMRGSAGDRELGLEIIRTLSPELARTLAEISAKYRAPAPPKTDNSKPRVLPRGPKRAGMLDAPLVGGPGGSFDGPDSKESGSALVATARAFGNEQLYAQADRAYLEAAANPHVVSKADPRKLAQATALYRASQFYEACQLFQEGFAAVNQ